MHSFRDRSNASVVSIKFANQMGVVEQQADSCGAAIWSTSWIVLFVWGTFSI
tara:strand:+ start:284 stop:439 length:156 start_codon:yes stop_codon:yes gene_type:complete